MSDGSFDPLSKSSDPSPGLGWDQATQEVWKLTPGTWLGFGAIGKGCALDHVRGMIELAGFENYLLSAGGIQHRFVGARGAQHPLEVGMELEKGSPRAEVSGLLSADDSGKKIALGVSGTHEKGQHLIGARANLKSALIGLPSAADADALSTALFVSGWDESKTFFGGLPIAPAAGWIDETETPHWNGVFQNLWDSVKSLALFLMVALPLLALQAQSALCDEAVDLGGLSGGSKDFTPYVFDRNSAWILLPVFCFLVVLSHLIKTKPSRARKTLMKKDLTSKLTVFAAVTLTCMHIEMARASELEPMGKAIASILGTTKAFKKVLNDGNSNVDVYYSKGANGKAEKVVFIEKGLYLSDCTHAWAIGLNAATNKVTEVRLLEMGCPTLNPPHLRPTWISIRARAQLTSPRSTRKFMS